MLVTDALLQHPAVYLNSRLLFRTISASVLEFTKDLGVRNVTVYLSPTFLTPEAVEELFFRSRIAPVKSND